MNKTCESSEVKLAYLTILPQTNSIYKLNLQSMPASLLLSFFPCEEAEIAQHSCQIPQKIHMNMKR